MIRNKQLLFVFVSLAMGVAQARHFDFGFGFNTGDAAFQFSVGRPAYVQPVYYAPMPMVQYESCFVAQPVYRPVQVRTKRVQPTLSCQVRTGNHVKKARKKRCAQQNVHSSHNGQNNRAVQKPALALALIFIS